MEILKNKYTAFTLKKHLKDVNFLIRQLELAIRNPNNISGVIFSDLVNIIDLAKTELEF